MRLVLWDLIAKFGVSANQILAKMADLVMMSGLGSNALVPLGLKGSRVKIKTSAIPTLVVMVEYALGQMKEMALNVLAERDTKGRVVKV